MNITDLLSIIEKLPTIPPHAPDRYQVQGGVDDENVTNGMRVEWAGTSLAVFQEVTHNDDPLSPEDASDLIADLLHWLHANDYDVVASLGTAVRCFVEEAGPLVTDRFDVARVNIDAGVVEEIMQRDVDMKTANAFVERTMQQYDPETQFITEVLRDAYKVGDAYPNHNPYPRPKSC